jgi:hypothetical protein
MRILLEALCKHAHGRIVEINDIVRLRQANDATLRTRVHKLAGSIRAKGVRERAAVQCVFIHEDFDEIDSTTRANVRRRVQEALGREITRVYYVLATWEIEAWLLMFPDALTEFASSWSVPSRYLGADTGRVRDPKRVMKREVAKAGPGYRESDAPDIAELIAGLGLQCSPSGQNLSYNEFLASASSCCDSL